MAYSVKLILGYENSNQTRSLLFNDLPSETINNVKTRAKAVNASISGGTDDGLASFFKDDDGNNFSGIQAAQIIAETVKNIDLSGGAE